MEGYEPETYGDRIADVYDDASDPARAERIAEVLASLAGPGPALELGIGTGRVALPLAARGVEVHGIDVSERMVERMRAKPGGDRTPVTFASLEDIPLDGPFGLVYCVAATIFGPRTQEGQVRCFARVARVLAPGGVFVVEAFVPDLARFDRGQRVNIAPGMTVDRVVIDATTVDRATQLLTFHKIVLSEAETNLYPGVIRYAYPSELDLMARLGGLRLRERWGGWEREPYTAASEWHVSVYERA